MKSVKSFVIGASLLFAGSAAAQGAEPAPTETPPDPNAGGAGAGMEGTVEATPPATGGMASIWFKQVISRPYVLPASKLAVTGQFFVAKISFIEPITMMPVSSTGAGLQLGGHYGVTDKITAGGLYSFSVKDFEIKGPLTVYGAFQIAHSAKMSVAATAAFTYDLNAEAASVMAGLGLRYNVTDKIGVFTGAPLAPGPVGNHLKLSFADKGPMSFDVNAGVGLQATPELFAYLATNIAHINISNDATAIFGADFLPLTLGGQFAVTDQLDVNAFFQLPDLKEAQFDLYAFGVGATFRP